MKFFGLTNEERMTQLANDLDLAFMDQTFDRYKQALRDRGVDVLSIKQAVSEANVAVSLGGVNFYDTHDWHMMTAKEMLVSQKELVKRHREKLNHYIDAFIESYGKDKVSGSVHVNKDSFFTSLSIELTRKDDAVKSVAFGESSELELSPV